MSGLAQATPNADTELFARTLKVALVWINEGTSPNSFLEALDGWVDDYNTDSLHSTLDFRSPEAFEAEHLNREILFADAC